MKRSRVVRPDTVIERFDGKDQVAVSRQAAQIEVLAALDTLLLAGGEFTVSSKRAPTEFEGEAVSMALFITWYSGSARTSNSSPERVEEPVFAEAYEDRDETVEEREIREQDESDRGPVEEVEDLTAAR